MTGTGMTGTGMTGTGMTAIGREWVSSVSPTAGAAGHGPNPCQGIYHRTTGRRPTTAFIATHYNVDFSEHYLAPLLAEHGFGFLGWNTRYRGNEAYFLLEHAVVDIGVGVRWLRETAGVETVVVLGNSGGGSLMAAYQSQATAPDIRPARGTQLTDAVADLPAADLYVSLNAHPGRPEVLTSWLDAAIVDEHEPFVRDDDLDLFDRRHGPPFEPEFVARYRAAQVARNERITDWAIAELDRLAAADLARDRLFLLHGVWADPRFVDLTLDPSDREPGCYAGDPARANAGVLGIGRTNTLRSWLSMWSLRESDCRGAPHLGRIDVPALVVQSTADRGVFPSDARAIHEALGSTDRTLEFVPGEHYFETGGRDHVAELISDWVSTRTR